MSPKAIAIALGTLVLAWGALSTAVVNAFHVRAPSVALAFHGDDPVALVRDAQLRLNTGEIEGGSDALLRIVQRSVAGSPLNGPAFRLYGLTSAANADVDGVRAQMAISDRLERRDVAAQLWLIEDAVARNDVAGALRHYDTALRIEESSRAILYPVLTDALESPLIRERFVPLMSSRAPWLESFLRYAVSNTRDPTAIADLARAAGGFPEGPAFSTIDRELLTQLITFEEFDAAIAHFRRIDGADEGILGDLALTASSTNNALAPVTWQPFQIDGIETFVIAAGQGGGAEIEAEMEAGYKGPVARRLLALEPGRYRFSARLRASGHASADALRWLMLCAGADGVAPLLDQNAALAEQIDLASDLVVPEGCAVQSVMVSADTQVASGYVTLVMVSASLERIAPPRSAGGR